MDGVLVHFSNEEVFTLVYIEYNQSLFRASQDAGGHLVNAGLISLGLLPGHLLSQSPPSPSSA